MRDWWDNKIAAASTETLLVAAREAAINYIDLTSDAMKTEIVTEMLRIVKSEHAIVREGAIYGFWEPLLAEARVQEVLEKIALTDTSQTIRECAVSVLNSLEWRRD